jgi:hypothetical protein
MGSPVGALSVQLSDTTVFGAILIQVLEPRRSNVSAHCTWQDPLPHTICRRDYICFDRA